jgi:hypothetical protein
MKKTITVERTKKVKETIEVDFPLFLQGGDTFDSGGGYDSWIRVDKDLTAVVLRRDYDGEWEIDKYKKWTEFSSPMYYTTSSIEKFESALTELEGVVEAIRRSLNE